MSNFLAIATVTATLKRTLEVGVNSDVNGAVVATGRPDTLADDGSPRINLYLYQVSPNASWRNMDLPTRSGEGSLTQFPHVALNLHYLLSFTGDESTLVPQRLLGSAVRTLVSRPWLGRDTIARTLQDQAYSAFLADSDLAKDIELVRVTPQHLSLEEMSKLWAVFPQTAYALSVSYTATVVLIKASEPPQAILPVRERRVFVAPMSHPFIDTVAALSGDSAPITASETLVIIGNQLAGETTALNFGAPGSVIKLDPAVAGVLISDTRLEVPMSTLITTLNLRAGPQGVQVMHPIDMVDPPSPPATPAHPAVGFESNVETFVFRPTVANPSSVSVNPPVIKVDVNPKVGLSQRAQLLLNPKPPAAGNAFTINSDDTGRVDDSTTLRFPVTSVPAGDYFMRVMIDGAVSLLAVDQNNAFKGPILQI